MRHPFVLISRKNFYNTIPSRQCQRTICNTPAHSVILRSLSENLVQDAKKPLPRNEKSAHGNNPKPTMDSISLTMISTTTNMWLVSSERLHIGKSAFRGIGGCWPSFYSWQWAQAYSSKVDDRLIQLPLVILRTLISLNHTLSPWSVIMIFPFPGA